MKRAVSLLAASVVTLGVAACQDRSKPDRQEEPSTPATTTDKTATVREDTERLPPIRPRGPTADMRANGPRQQADNTAANARDRSGTSPTPIDQGNDQADLDITQSIRKALMADDNLSFDAKNVKIITKDRKVTLRGTVDHDYEKDIVVAKARQAASTDTVDDELEVKR